MRPRPEGRGEPAPLRCLELADGRLQCGHDPKAVENAASAAAGNADAAASMRPRPEGRGERDGHQRIVNIEYVLQCGHDPKAVENVQQ